MRRFEAEILGAMLDAPRVVVATTTVDGATRASARVGPDGALTLVRLPEGIEVIPVSFTAAHAARAVDAFAAYGRGSGHRARLDYGDCTVYAVASVEGEPLLSTGDDFTHTDITPALR